MKLTIPVLMSLNAGYVDTAGFLALHGLFTAHVTGNFVTFGAALVHGTAGAGAKLLALPVFCAVIVATRLVSVRLTGRFPVLRTLLAAEFLLLSLGAGLAIHNGPFARGDAASTIVTGMILVAAMAIQNSVQRVHLTAAPPTTLMTGTTTQIMLDSADLLRGVSGEARAAARARLAKLAPSVLAFALGCGAGAVLFAQLRAWCFALPPVLALIPIFMQASRTEGSQ
jgi:uncharacterized membrane protein YoaK (UPF0700 family)